MLIAYEHMRTTRAHAHVRTYLHVHVCARTQKQNIHKRAFYMGSTPCAKGRKCCVLLHICETNRDARGLRCG